MYAVRANEDYTFGVRQKKGLSLVGVRCRIVVQKVLVGLRYKIERSRELVGLRYRMKKVKGIGWSKVWNKRSKRE